MLFRMHIVHVWSFIFQMLHTIHYHYIGVACHEQVLQLRQSPQSSPESSCFHFEMSVLNTQQFWYKPYHVNKLAFPDQAKQK